MGRSCENCESRAGATVGEKKPLSSSDEAEARIGGVRGV